MLQIYLKVLIIMAVFAAFAIPGYALKKAKMIGEGGTLTLSNLLLYVCQPALAINAFCVFSDEEWQMVQDVGFLALLKNFGICAAVSLLALVAMFGLCKLVFLKSKDRRAADVYSYIAVFSNCGFFGVPFVEMFTDGNPLAVMYVMVFNIVFMVLCWTLGVALITGSFNKVSVKKVLLNPAIIAIAVALLLFFVPQINVFMYKQVKELAILPEYLAVMTAPLSMLIVGIRVAESSPKQLFCKRGVYVAGALRLIVAPFLTLLVSLPFWSLLGSGAENGFEEFVYLAPVIAMAMSPAASVVAMAETFDGDRQTATSAFVTVTLLSVIIIPLVISAVMAICGV